MSIARSALFLFLAGCPYLGENGYTEKVRDLDGDGFVAERFGGPDCRDDDPTIGNCDADDDGYRDVRAGGDDCNDDSAAVNPDAVEICDDVDNDCDGLVDNDDPDAEANAPLIYRDADGDGYGDAGSTRGWCHPDVSIPSGYSDRADDCDDLNRAVNPQAAELCDDLDRNCDGDPVAGADDLALWYADGDGDGYSDGVDLLGSSCTPIDGGTTLTGDCDDDDADRHPGAEEVPYDGIDQDCDLDDLVDVDGDGVDAEPFGDDCDDNNASVHGARGNTIPAAAEACNLRDDDCDGVADDGLQLAYYPDTDGDLQGDADALPDLTCLPQAGWVANANDCDDTNPAIRVGAAESCDDIDNDCDNLIDEADPDVVGQVVRYTDRDGDAQGDPAEVYYGCLIHLPEESPAGEPLVWVTTGFDCDDDDASVAPGRDELCNNVDDDCDGRVDEAAIDALIFYEDNDGDGFGNSAAPVLTCPLFAGEYSRIDGDCNDADPETYPGAPEICGDAYRQDCSTVDPYDCDSDGFVASEQGGTDCDDTLAEVSPNGQEVCDGLDNDCDGLTDDEDPSNDASTVADWFQDADGDGVAGDILVITQACAPIPGAATVRGDCDEEDPDTYPNAPERCDGVDNDCDSFVDEGVSEADATKWYPDADGDGFGNRQSFYVHAQCEDPGDGTVADNDDCADNNTARNPLAVEICDGIDNDCDGLVDENDDDLVPDTFFADDDGDGYGRDGSVVYACQPPAGYIAIGGDCDDDNIAKNPGATEVCDGGIDNDCDGLADDNDPDAAGDLAWFPDADNDGIVTFTDADGDAVPDDDDGDGRFDDARYACTQPIGYDELVPTLFDAYGAPIGYAWDCADTDFLVSPSAAERCDNVDNDCDGLVDDDDDNLAFAQAWYRDDDLDGFGGDVVVEQCNAPTDAVYQALGGDCVDTNPLVSPVAQEICDGIDNDCDNLIDTYDPSASDTVWYVDNDGDGIGSATSGPTLEQCADPGAGYSAVAGDCFDNDADNYPGNIETCDNQDNDCDGLVDDLDEDVEAPFRFLDLDRDDYGDVAAKKCRVGEDALGDFYVDEPGDCDDDNDLVNPGAEEICDGEQPIDNDCDGLTEVDAGEVVATFWYQDLDGDEVGNADVSLNQCNDPGNGWVRDVSGDCSDDPSADAFAALRAPGNLEVCDDDNVDEDCDGLAENSDDDSDGKVFYNLDADNDQYVAEGVQVAFCDPPVGYVLTGTALGQDCDDTRNTVFPGAPEICDGQDNDCDGATDGSDSDDSNLDPWYEDLDGDGFGDPNKLAARSCVAPTNTVNDATDCLDDPSTAPPGIVASDVNPNAEERCDGVDTDCDPSTPEDAFAIDRQFVWPDLDNDGFGDASVTATFICYPGANEGLATQGGDCFDSGSDNGVPAREIFPGQTESCDTVDNDCDGLVDDDDPSRNPADLDLRVFAPDIDDDNFLDRSQEASFCAAPTGWKLVQGAPSEDCNDLDPSIFPGADEICDNRDNDCDGGIDDDDPEGPVAASTSTWYPDADGDGFGSNDPLLSMQACDQPVDFVFVSGDCRDDLQTVHPAAVVEFCNDIDDNCNGLIDTDDTFALPVDTEAFYVDNDGDTYGDAFAGEFCPNDDTLPMALVREDGDCVDSGTDGTVPAEEIFPGADELCNGVDDDCNGALDDDDAGIQQDQLSTAYEDIDNDGVGGALSPLRFCDPDAELFYSSMDGDCDDNDPNVGGTVAYYPDLDGDMAGDRYATPTPYICSSGPPPAGAPNQDDCNDSDPDVYAGSPLPAFATSSTELTSILTSYQAVQGNSNQVCDGMTVLLSPATTFSAPSLSPDIDFPFTLQGADLTSELSGQLTFNDAAAGTAIRTLTMIPPNTSVALSLQGSSPEFLVEGVVFDGTTTTQGRAIFALDANLTVRDSVFTELKGSGAAAVLDVSASSSDRALLMENNTISKVNLSNSGPLAGVGLLLQGFTNTLDVTIEGLFIEDVSSATGNHFTLQHDAGGLNASGVVQTNGTSWLINSSGDVVADDLVFTDNQTTSAGVFDVVGANSATISHAVFRGNTGSSFWFGPYPSSLSYTTVVGTQQLFGYDGHAVFVQTLGFLSLDHVLFFQNQGGDFGQNYASAPPFDWSHSFLDQPTACTNDCESVATLGTPEFITFDLQLDVRDWLVVPRPGSLVEFAADGFMYGYTGPSGIAFYTTSEDTLWDGWEYFWTENEFGVADLGLLDDGADADGDTVADEVEMMNGTNPFVSDTDGDGASDDVDTAPLDQDVQ